MIVYAFKYCDCIYESAYATESIHVTLKGAYQAMKLHRVKCYNDWRKLPNEYRKDFLDTFAKAWYIDKMEIKEP